MTQPGAGQVAAHHPEGVDRRDRRAHDQGPAVQDAESAPRYRSAPCVPALTPVPSRVSPTRHGPSRQHSRRLDQVFHDRIRCLDLPERHRRSYNVRGFGPILVLVGRGVGAECGRATGDRTIRPRRDPHSFPPSPSRSRLDPDGWEIAMALPKVVIVGPAERRQVVALQLAGGRRIAIVDDMAGVTRDRVGYARPARRRRRIRGSSS